MRKLQKIAVAGAGTMGSSMAQTFAKFGHPVVLYDIFPQALEKSERLININQETEIAEGIVTKEESEALKKRITYTTDMSLFHDVDFVVEAVLEKLDVKHTFWKEASSIVPEDALLASNTSGLSISRIAEVVKNPERFAGMHWINPPHLIPLIEVIKGEKTGEGVAEAIYALCEELQKKPVIVKDAPGFALNRIQLAILRECFYIVDQGIASAEDVDKVMKYALGIRYACLGPLEVADHGGLDIFYNIASYLFEDLCDAKEPFGLLKKCFEEGNFGVKTGKGIYDYSDGKDKDAIMYRDRMYTKVSACVLE